VSETTDQGYSAGTVLGAVFRDKSVKDEDKSFGLDEFLTREGQILGEILRRAGFENEGLRQPPVTRFLMPFAVEKLFGAAGRDG
jgi:hypothetical protein